jgi:hypothetical protein
VIRVVYIAGPFRGASSWAIEQNIRRAEELALKVWALGAAALCPHANTRFFQYALPDDVWLQGDMAMLAKCDAILMTPDWQVSAGARAEHDRATADGLPVFYDLAELAAWLPTGS